MLTFCQMELLNNPGTGGVELCPGYGLALSQHSDSSSNQNNIFVDCTLHRKSPTTFMADPTRWHQQHALVQFRDYDSENDDDARDVFDDVLGKPQSMSTTEAFARLASHVAYAYNHQPRLALYVFFVTRRALRVTRWDRSGVIITPAVDYADRWCGPGC